MCDNKVPNIAEIMQKSIEEHEDKKIIKVFEDLVDRKGLKYAMHILHYRIYNELSEFF